MPCSNLTLQFFYMSFKWVIVLGIVCVTCELVIDINSCKMCDEIYYCILTFLYMFLHLNTLVKTKQKDGLNKKKKKRNEDEAFNSNI